MKVLFIQPENFLRSTRKTNPFFDLIVKICETNGFDWELWLPSITCEHGYSVEHVKSYSRINKVAIWIYRALHYCFMMQQRKSWILTGLLLGKIIWQKKNKPDVVITIGGFWAAFLSGALKKTRVVDIQHGVIFSKHSGYFNKDARLAEKHLFNNMREFWLYGQGFADCFFRHPDNVKDLQGRVKVIGDVIRAGERHLERVGQIDRNVVVFSLQLTADLSTDEIVASVAKMEEFFAEFFSRSGDKFVCYVKHHPRFNNVYDLSSFYEKFPQVKETKKPWTELYPRMALHVTFNSTVTFDCASHGIPTFLVDLPSARILVRDFYKDDYRYPYYDKSVFEILALPTEESRSAILTWYHRFYTPFSEENCLKLLKGMK